MSTGRCLTFVQLRRINLDASFKARLKQVRGDKSQAVFARDLGVSSSAVGQYERGEQLPGMAFLLAVHGRYNVSLDWLILGKEESPAQNESVYAPTRDSIDYSVNRDLMDENRELNAENRRLWKENGDLRVQLAELKARAAPSKEEPPEAAQDCA